jgi:hypothetical protein
VGNGDEREWEGGRTLEEREDETSYRRSTELDEKGGEPISASFWSPVGKGGTTVKLSVNIRTRRRVTVLGGCRIVHE